MTLKKIYLDTNFLLIPFKFGVDIFQEIDKICLFPYKLYIINKTFDELNKIIDTQKGKHKEFAKLALKLIEQKSLNITAFSNELDVDDNLVNLSNTNVIIATLDKELKNRIKSKNGQVIILRNKNYLELSGEINVL